MGEENSHYYDLSILMRFGDVNFLKVARSNLALKVADYYELLSNLENNASKGADALNKIASLAADENDLKNLADVKDLLRDIGCTKIVPEIDEIFTKIKIRRFDPAANEAKKILEEYTRLQKRILAAKKTGKPEPKTAVTEGDETPPVEFEEQSLKDALLQLEQEEASRKLRILAVDDAPVMIKTISAALSDTYKVYGMTNPTMLEKFLGQITPDLFLLDYQMPEINGFELIPIIRNFEEHKTTPIIFLTSMGTIDHVSTAASLGACDFIVKPFQGDNLLEKVAKHIVRKNLLF